VIDLHSHILPGVDDGTRSLEQAVELARSAVDDGIVALAATPHVRDDYPTTADEMERKVAELRVALRREQIPLRLLSGGELALDRAATLPLEEIERFALAGSSTYVLVEFPYSGWPLALEPVIARLARAGLTAVIAHPERNVEVQEAPEQLESALAAGALIQVTATSVTGALGRSSRAAARELLRRRMVHLLASDAHAPEVRAVGLRAARDAVGNDDLAEYLTVTSPSAIERGEPVADPPPLAVSRFSWRRR
jgi:protein-tyrosine phosphatase